LKPHTVEKHRGEVVFKSGITLCVKSAVYDDHEITFLNTRKLFSDRHTQVQTSYLYWQDSQWVLRTLGPKNIVEIEGPASFIDDVSYICGLNFTRPDGQQVQHIFGSAGTERDECGLRPIKVLKTGVTGWKYTQ